MPCTCDSVTNAAPEAPILQFYLLQFFFFFFHGRVFSVTGSVVKYLLVQIFLDFYTEIKKRKRVVSPTPKHFFPSR